MSDETEDKTSQGGSFVNTETRIANQNALQHIYGGQHNYFSTTSLNEAQKTLASEQADLGISLPFSTVLTYTERATLSQTLETELSKPYASSRLAHAAAVVGLGGTGKTQLVLRYVESHRDLYTTLLWLDARTEQTVRSSFDRFCVSLALPVAGVAGGSNGTLLRDSAAVQTVLRWLARQSEDKAWLVVIDNADDVASHVRSVIPQGPAGSVILISQDGGAARVFGRGCGTVSVDAMQTHEATALLWNALGTPESAPDTCTMRLLERIVSSLDRLPLAVDLAGAGIEADVDCGEGIRDALRSYISDFQAHQDSLLKRTDFSATSSYGKTVWTAWETSLTSLHTVEEGCGDILPRQLLSFLTFFDCANMQEEMFRLASLGFEALSPGYKAFQPWWMARMLQRNEKGDWDAYTYRETARTLRRFGFVRPVLGQWKGLTMHGLVQWRAKAAIDPNECMWESYLLFIGAVCHELLTEERSVSFRRHFTQHLPSCTHVLQLQPGQDQELRARVWHNIGLVWQKEGQLAKAEQMLSAAYDLWRCRLGDDHPVTLIARMDLATTLRFQGRLQDAEQSMMSASQAMSTVMGEDCPETLSAMADLALTYRDQGRWAESKELSLKVLATRVRVLGEDHTDTLETMSRVALICRSQGLMEEAEQLAWSVFEARRRVLGEQHPDTLIMGADNAVAYCNGGRWDEAETLCTQVMAVFSEIYGEEHPSTMAAVAKLASTCFHQRKFTEAAQLFCKVVQVRIRIFGETHPQTLTAMANAAHSLRGSGRLRDALATMKRVEDLSEETHGAEHPYTICRGQYVIDWEDELAWQPPAHS